jgi:hypothetical protein
MHTVRASRRLIVLMASFACLIHCKTHDSQITTITNQIGNLIHEKLGSLHNVNTEHDVQFMLST